LLGTEAMTDAEAGKEQPWYRRGGRAAAIANRLTCSICGELYKEATTISECLHTFCRDCIDSRIIIGTNSNKCPECNTPIAPDPYSLKQILYDRNLDDIVRKLFPRDDDGARAKKRQERALEEQALARKRAPPVLQAPAKRRRGKPSKNAVPAPNAGSGDIMFGCSKCRYSRNGCSSCRAWLQNAKQEADTTPSALESGKMVPLPDRPGPEPSTCPSAPSERRASMKFTVSPHPECKDQLPPLHQPFFKVRHTVRVGTLITHVKKRLNSEIDIQLTCNGDVLPDDWLMEEIEKAYSVPDVFKGGRYSLFFKEKSCTPSAAAMPAGAPTEQPGDLSNAGADLSMPQAPSSGLVSDQQQPSDTTKPNNEDEPAGHSYLPPGGYLEPGHVPPTTVAQEFQHTSNGTLPSNQQQQ